MRILPVRLAAALVSLLVAPGSDSLTAKGAEIVGTLHAEITKTIHYGYLVQLPEGYADSASSWPLVMFLHGSGERGSDIEKVKVWGPPSFIAKGERSLPAVVVSPQCPDGESWEPLGLVALLDRLLVEFRIDPKRVYATGLSMGGAGTWALATTVPERLAAIVPICGYGNVAAMPRLAGLPCWVFHGLDDEAVRVDESLRLVNALNELGAPVRLTVYPKAGHIEAWQNAYDNPRLWEWLFAQRRE